MGHYLDDAHEAQVERIRAHERVEHATLMVKIRAAKAHAESIIEKRKQAAPTPLRTLGMYLDEFQTRYHAEKTAFALAALGHDERNLPSEDPLLLDITGTVDAELMLRIVSALRSNPCATTLIAIIDTCGGDPGSALEIFHVLVGHPAKNKAALVSGQCHSAGMLIGLGCRKRVASSASTFCFHAMNWGRHPPTAQEKIFAEAYDVLEEIVASAHGVPLDVVQSLRKSGAVFNAADALSMGYIHEVIAEDELAAALEPEEQHYEIETVGGTRARLPLRTEIVEGIAATIRAGKCAALGFGLPSAYRDAIAASLGLTNGS